MDNNMEMKLSKNLRNACFKGISINLAYFECTTMRSCTFEDATLRSANFKDSYVIGGSFQNAIITNSNFKGAYMIGTDFENACFKYCDFEGAIIECCTLDKAIFEDSTFKGAKFKDCTLKDTKFTDCKDYQETFFMESTLKPEVALKAEVKNMGLEYLFNLKTEIETEIEFQAFESVQFLDSLSGEEIDPERVKALVKDWEQRYQKTK